MFTIRLDMRLPRAARTLASFDSPCSFIAGLVVLASTLASVPIASAQNRLDPVVVSGTREPERASRSTADIVVIDAETIRRSMADSVEDLLRREAGMQVTRTGGPGQTAGFFIRGSSTSSTLVLVDGVRIGSATLGQAEFEALNLAQIDRIEVLRGPASSLYGADALGGVVQIFTKKGEGEPRLHAGVALGGERSRKGDAGVSGSTGAFDYAATLARESSRGVSAIRPNDAFGYYNPDRDGYSRNSGNVRLGYTPMVGHRIGLAYTETRLHAQFDSADFNPPFFAPDSSPDFRNRLTTRVGAVDYRGVFTPLYTTTVQLGHSTDDLTSGGTSPTRFKTDREQATWQNAFHFGPDSQVLLAYEHLREKADATQVFSQALKRHNNGFVVGYSGRFGAHDLQADVRSDANSAYGHSTTGRLGYAFHITPQLKLRALAGTSFRAPTFNDLAYPFFGVPTIRPERGRSVELGAEWQADGTSASATLYRNRVRQLIGYDPDPTGTRCPPFYFGCAANVSRAVLQGATIAATRRFGNLDLRATVDFLDATDAATHVRLPRRAAHQETLSADWNFDTWRVGAALLDIGSRPDGGLVLGGYGVLDLRATWRFLPQWQLEAKLANALDHRVEPVRDYAGLGRQAWLGVRFDGVGF